MERYWPMHRAKPQDRAENEPLPCLKSRQDERV
jgi:hypothetical protein